MTVKTSAKIGVEQPNMVRYSVTITARIIIFCIFFFMGSFSLSFGNDYMLSGNTFFLDGLVYI